jgi:hypothetical protein
MVPLWRMPGPWFGRTEAGCWCRGGSKLGVFPLAVDGLPTVVENEPSWISAGPALGVPFPGIKLGVPCVASQW